MSHIEEISRLVWEIFGLYGSALFVWGPWTAQSTLAVVDCPLGPVKLDRVTFGLSTRGSLMFAHMRPAIKIDRIWVGISVLVLRTCLVQTPLMSIRGRGALLCKPLIELRSGHQLYIGSGRLGSVHFLYILHNNFWPYFVSKVKFIIVKVVDCLGFLVRR